MNWKRKFHKENNTKLLETYSYYSSQGCLLEKLEELLLENNVKLTPCDSNELMKRIDDRLLEESIKELIKVIETFITLFKANNYPASKFNEFKNTIAKEQFSFIKSRETILINFIEEIYFHYQEKLKKDDSIDFSDMIIQATNYINDSIDFKKYSYIIIDEYQDISKDRYDLVKALLVKNNAKLMCVGDDWQSIYRFAGSDINLITNFEKLWGKTALLKIENTYRNSQELIDIAGQFILANPNQIKKSLTSAKKSQVKSVVVCEYETNYYYTALKSAIDDIVNAHTDKSNLLFLARNNYEIENLIKGDSSFKASFDFSKITYSKYPDLSIQFLTVHRSKGLEADNIIILNAINGLSGFPNKIENDRILNFVLIQPEEFEYAEERRLFYVAMTRTKNLAYILVPRDNPSVFIKELPEDACSWRSYPEKNKMVADAKCPKCETGRLLIRKSNNSNSPFLGCSNYPLCDFTYRNLDLLKNLVKCSCGGYFVERHGMYGTFYGCTNYPYCRETLQEESNE